MSRVCVVGGGPAGIIAASEAAARGHEVILLEKNEKLGKKLYITGKGRCNLTNSADTDDFFENIPRNPKFLYSALYSFTNMDIIALVEKNGVKTKVERGGRVFPESDKSSDVIRALTKNLQSSGAVTRFSANVESIAHGEAGFIVTVDKKAEHYDAVVIATGGVSYPSTGSTGDGYKLAASLGHTVLEPRATLVPFETEQAWPFALTGLTLKNVTLTAYKKGRKVFSELGELLFTHFGVSGPLVLSASARVADAPEGTRLVIDLKPALDEETLDRRILRDFEKNIRRQFANSLSELLPSRLIDAVVELCGISGAAPVCEITREQRRKLVSTLKNLELTVKRAAPIEEAIVTRGGVSVKEINASSMESKLVENLFFAGEVIDVDAYTGGFNLQIAYSTGALAGRNVR